MAIYLGIDAGGTKTAFALCDERGNILANTESGTIHPKQVSADKIKNTLTESIKYLVDSIGCEISNIDFCFAGLPGYGEFPEIITLYNEIFEEVLKSKNFKLGNDSVAGWAGSQAGKPGVNMVLGTGAIAFGIDYEGNEERSSGWGSYCGDEGSAYWIGRKAISIFGKQSDGRLEKGPLYEIIRNLHKLQNDFDFISDILMLEDNRTEVAKYSKVLSKAAIEGDKSCIKVIDEVVEEAYIAIQAVIKKLNFSETDKIYVSYSGGVFKIGELLKNKLEKLLLKDERIEIIDSILTPIQGSLLMALKFSKNEITDEIVENLKTGKKC